MNLDAKDLMDVHEAIASVLDAKLKDVPEWRAFRKIDRLLLEASAEPLPTPSKPSAPRVRLRINDDAPTPYMTLADMALAESGMPLSTSALMEYIGWRRKIGDSKKARTVVQSSLSKDKRFQSVPWEGGRAWWYADKPIPVPNKGCGS